MTEPDPGNRQKRSSFSGGPSTLFWRLLPARLADLLSSRRARVDGPSMEPTLRQGDLLLVSRSAYVRSRLARGDIVLLHDPQRESGYIKRVVGLPTEAVAIHEGSVLINNIPLAEPYETQAGPEAAHRDGQWTLGGDEYFVLGDNRNDSLDSRAFGPVSARQIRGRVWYRYAPADRAGMLQRLPREGV